MCVRVGGRGSGDSCGAVSNIILAHCCGHTLASEEPQAHCSKAPRPLDVRDPIPFSVRQFLSTIANSTVSQTTP